MKYIKTYETYLYTNPNFTNMNFNDTYGDEEERNAVNWAIKQFPYLEFIKIKSKELSNGFTYLSLIFKNATGNKNYSAHIKYKDKNNISFY